MLEGGTDASNTDAYAEKPTAQNHWIKTADPDTSVPYMMWAGTPYQHLMAPVK